MVVVLPAALQVPVEVAESILQKLQHAGLSFWIKCLTSLNVVVAIGGLVLANTQRIGLVDLLLVLNLGINKLGTRSYVTSLNYVIWIIKVVF